MSILVSDNPYSATSFGSPPAATTVPNVANNTTTTLPIITTTPPATVAYADPSKLLMPSIKLENTHWESSYDQNTTSAFSNQLQVTVPQYGGGGMYSYPSPQSTNSSMSYENQLSVFPPSPTPSSNSGDFNHSTYLGSNSNSYCHFKQEPNLLLPPSPPDSNGAPSPSAQFYMDQIKMEPLDYQPQHQQQQQQQPQPHQLVDNSVPLEDCVDIEEYFRGIRPESLFRPIDSAPSVEEGATASGANDSKDHQLLREYLQDTSFQRKHNLKPVALESLFGGWESRGDIEPVISLAIEQARRDVEDTCAALNISPGKREFGVMR